MRPTHIRLLPKGVVAERGVHTPSSRCHYGGTSPAVGATPTAPSLFDDTNRALRSLLPSSISLS